jgi:thiamine kinase-like enzyme
MSALDLSGQHIVRYFGSRADEFGLNRPTLKAERVLNWGGFGTHSYRVSDGKKSVHVKLAADQVDMRRWLTVHDLLEDKYRAPRVLAWADLPGTSFGGIVFEHIEGETWNTAAHPTLFHEVRSLLDQLHGDKNVAEFIRGGPRSYRQCWELRYREQFEEDLKTVTGCRPASVTDDRLIWMEQEAKKVLALGADCDAFKGMTRSPCHWDLWPNNVMVEEGGRWWVLDWDSLAVGDEAEDYATLVWPFVCEHGKDWREMLVGGWDGPFAARMDLHLRSITLDYVIDVLADWAECDVPEWREEVRRRKEAEHLKYLDWYQDRWG